MTAIVMIYYTIEGIYGPFPFPCLCMEIRQGEGASKAVIRYNRRLATLMRQTAPVKIGQGTLALQELDRTAGCRQVMAASTGVIGAQAGETPRLITSRAYY